MSGLPGLQYSDDILPPSPKRVRVEERKPVDEEVKYDLDDDDFYDTPKKPAAARAHEEERLVAESSPQGETSTNAGLPGLIFEENVIAITGVDKDHVRPESPKSEHEDSLTQDADDFYEPADAISSKPEDTANHKQEEEAGDATMSGDGTLIGNIPGVKDSRREPTHGTSADPPEVKNPSDQEQTQPSTMPLPSQFDELEARLFGGLGANTALLPASEPVSHSESDRTVVSNQPAGASTMLEVRTTSGGEVASPGIEELPEPNHTAAKVQEGHPTASEGNKEDPNAEWRFDSSDAVSSESDSDTSSSDQSSSDEDDESDDGNLLDPETQAKMLLEALGDEDDGGPTASGPLKTANEKQEEILPKPDITVTPDMAITELGWVETMVGNFMLIKGITSGTYRVVEAGSALCLADRTVIGAVMEPMGRVQQPMYSMGFKDQEELTKLGVEKGTKVFYVDAHSTYVFTEPLKALKGTDASNLHDEEIAVEEIEFSDDEKEAEYKRNIKKSKGDRRNERVGGKQGSDRQTAATKSGAYLHPDSVMSDARNKPINYDDEDDEGTGEEIYHRLERPDNLHEMMTHREPTARGGHRGRGAAQRGRGGQGANDRGRGRGENRGGHKAGNFHRENNRGRKRGGFSRGRGQMDYQQNGSRHQSPHQASSRKGGDFSHSPRPGSSHQQRHQHRSDGGMGNATSQSNQPVYPPVGVPPPPLDPANLMNSPPPGGNFNHAQFTQNYAQNTNGYQYGNHQQQQHMNSNQHDHGLPQQQWSGPPPPFQFQGQQMYQQTQQQLQQQPFQTQYGHAQNYPPNGTPNQVSGQIDVAALLRNLQYQGNHRS